jgi:alanyl-tRNA synthetase
VTSREIRNRFLQYFSDNGHTIVPSSSLVPEKDPSLLFVNAGMVQFKNVFLGIDRPGYRRATTCQKCVRAGGKHNDLENVGKTLRHHTFFEMLGNFSFGDYFKKEAVFYAWDLLTKIFNLDQEKLWITVYKEDSEAENIWKSIGVRADRIVRLGEKDNFWSMGDEGPCGPCSEIIYDLGDEVGCKQATCAVGCDCDRYLEIWNLVFMEFERTLGGEMKKLPRPSIDTGMGLERITSVLQGKIGNYETDLFTPILLRLQDISHLSYGENMKTDIAFRVIADHLRGATFIINDGVLPSKEGRGYVLRRIIRRALRYGRKIGIEKEFFYDLSGVIVDIMGDAYPDIKNNHPYLVRVIRGEEERFTETLSQGIRLYEEITEGIRSQGQQTIAGELIYKLYDTFGFPPDITREMAEEDGLAVDMEGFQKALQEQKKRSKTSSKIKGETLGEGEVAVLRENIRNTFVGYEKLETEGVILNAVKDESLAEMIGTGEDGEVFVDTTPFYAESGGQVSDTGVITSASGKGRILEVTKIKDDLFAHRVHVEEGSLGKGETVRLMVDSDKRKSTARNHTATHLLQYALRTVLGDHVKQSGSMVQPERLRFDFTHFKGLDAAEITRVEDIVNEKIMDCVTVTTELKGRDEAIREGATALFEEKYGETVRVLRIGDFSTELCGGTHAGNTGEIGSFYVVSEGSLASGVRRIEAVTGTNAIAYKRRLEATIDRIAELAGAEKDRVAERVQSIANDLREKEREIERFKEEVIAARVDESIRRASVVKGAKVISLFVPDATAEDLRKVTDVVRGKVQSCITVAVSRDHTKGMIVVAVTKDLQGLYNAGKIVRTVTEKYHGKGGGGPQIAQGGISGDSVEGVLAGLTEVLENLN